MYLELIVSTEGNETAGYVPIVSLSRNGRIANRWRLMREDEETIAYEQAKKKAAELFPDVFQQLD